MALPGSGLWKLVLSTQKRGRKQSRAGQLMSRVFGMVGVVAPLENRTHTVPMGLHNGKIKRLSAHGLTSTYSGLLASRTRRHRKVRQCRPLSLLTLSISLASGSGCRKAWVQLKGGLGVDGCLLQERALQFQHGNVRVKSWQPMSNAWSTSSQPDFVQPLGRRKIARNRQGKILYTELLKS